MPVLSRFYEIIIRMYFLQSEHNPPHIHAIYNDDVAAIGFMTGEVKTPFDGLIAFSDATELWKLSESTLRKAVSYGKLVDGVDVCKFGKQRIISADAMKRKYEDITCQSSKSI